MSDKLITAIFRKEKYDGDPAIKAARKKAFSIFGRLDNNINDPNIDIRSPLNVTPGQAAKLKVIFSYLDSFPYTAVPDELRDDKKAVKAWLLSEPQEYGWFAVIRTDRAEEFDQLFEWGTSAYWDYFSVMITPLQGELFYAPELTAKEWERLAAKVYEHQTPAMWHPPG